MVTFVSIPRFLLPNSSPFHLRFSAKIPPSRFSFLFLNFMLTNLVRISPYLLLLHRLLALTAVDLRRTLASFGRNSLPKSIFSLIISLLLRLESLFLFLRHLRQHTSLSSTSITASLLQKRVQHYFRLDLVCSFPRFSLFSPGHHQRRKT
jgi:hypothetical protein